MHPGSKSLDHHIDAIFVRSAENAPGFELSREVFLASVRTAVEKFARAAPEEPSRSEEREFVEALHADDLYLALACAEGNEKAWWNFDRNYRGYIESIARHLSGRDVNYDDVVEVVYTELYGTRVVEGRRVSKFASYSGRGGLKSWLRTVIWHCVVDLHRIDRGDLSLDEMTENVGEGAAHSYLPASGGETEVFETIERNRFGPAVITSLDHAFSALEDHERLLLLYYHVDGLKLREIAPLLQDETSILRRWFRKKTPGTERTYESTVMRWLDRTHAKVLETFRSELRSKHNFSDEELERCAELVLEDLPGTDIFRKLRD